MKNKVLFFAIISLFLLIVSVGCKKDASEIEFLKQQIIGTWEWTVSHQPGIVWEITPIPGEKRELTFTDNQILATHNMESIDGNPVITNNKKVVMDGSYDIYKKMIIFILL